LKLEEVIPRSGKIDIVSGDLPATQELPLASFNLHDNPQENQYQSNQLYAIHNVFPLESCRFDVRASVSANRGDGLEFRRFSPYRKCKDVAIIL